MALKLTLYTNDEVMVELGKVEVAHITNFKDNETRFHPLFQSQLIDLIHILIENHVSFSVDNSNSITIDLTRLSIRIDSSC